MSPKKAVIVADQCPHCKSWKKRIEEKGMDVEVINATSDEGFKFVKKHGIRAVPRCVVIFEDGKKVRECSTEELEDLLG